MDFENGTVEFNDKQLRIKIKDVCGSLVQVHEPGDRVELVHQTAKK